MIHGDAQAGQVGETKTMHNSKTGEMLTYHFDRQKGVGKKYNFSWGFERVTAPLVVKANKDSIPGYDDYKVCFTDCDLFNRGLKDRTFPNKRGGKGTAGESGRVHDFHIGVALQNTFNASEEIMGGDERSFMEKCYALSEQLYAEAINM